MTRVLSPLTFEACLHYPVKGAVVLAMTRFLPDAFWRQLLGAGMTRRPKGR
jgi:hypothetical protein